jgi:hypothetical protein
MWGRYMREFIDNQTPLNRDNMMALQGFDNIETNIDENVIVQNTNSGTLTTTINEKENGSVEIVEVFVGEKTITKTTTINADGDSISEVLS